MDGDGLLVEFFAAKLGPDESEEETHEKDNDGFGRIRGSGGDGDGGGSDKGSTIGEIFEGAYDMI